MFFVVKVQEDKSLGEIIYQLDTKVFLRNEKILVFAFILLTLVLTSFKIVGTGLQIRNNLWELTSKDLPFDFLMPSEIVPLIVLFICFVLLLTHLNKFHPKEYLLSRKSMLYILIVEFSLQIII